MAKLGSPVTNKYPIGTAELRIGALSSAGQLTQSHSIGVVDEASMTVAQNSVDLLGGFPQTTLDSAIISQEASLTATLREGSRRNLRLMLGEGVSGTADADVESLVVTDESAAATSVGVSVGEGGNFTDGKFVVMYTDGQPESVQVAQITGITGDVLTISPALIAAVNGATTTVKIFEANEIAVGGISQTNYFAASLVQTEASSGRPVGFDLWKCSVSGSMDYSTNATDFASFSLEIKVLQPSASEIGSGGALNHIESAVLANPSGRYVGGAD